jgi:DHA1 family bicyclomycin/chloramphenicol resistance-like MFS transporter
LQDKILSLIKKIGYFLPITLGLISAFGPFVTDFYLPAMPEMATYFKTSPSMVSLSLTAGMTGLALGQILIGPLSDKYGRKRPLIISIVVFVVASLLCVFSPNIHVFNLMRMFQG